MDTPQTTDPGDGAKTGECRPNISDAFRAGTPTSQASRGRSTSRSRCLRRQLTQLLKEGSECFNPDEVRRIVQAARGDPGPGRLRSPALDSGGLGGCNKRHGAHHGPGCLDRRALPKPGPEGGGRHRFGGQQDSAGRDEGCDSRPPQRCTAGADNKIGVREKSPHRSGRNERWRPSPGDNPGSGARRQPSG
jgi:hypothetical protein